MDQVRPGPEERGFVLIAAIWLLILAGSITAILMLRSLGSATAAAEHQDSVERRLALDSAVETMLADRMFSGNRSAWWAAPAAGTIAIGERQISLRVTSESGRLDVNGADPALIDAALQGFGIAADERSRIVARVTALRATRRTISSLPELSALIGSARARGGACLADALTWISGLSEPRPDQMPSDLARALGGRGGATSEPRPSPPEAGAALRIEASESGRPAMIAIVRTSGLPEQPTSVSVWGAPAPCPPPITPGS
jgi:general secretion pathway protein K